MRIVIRKPTEYAGELGAGKTYPVNVDAWGYADEPLDSPAMVASIKSIIKSHGWGVGSVSVSKSPVSGMFYINVGIKAITNTQTELDKIKNGVESNLMQEVFREMRGISASFAGAAAQSEIKDKVSTFSFQISKIGGEDLKDKHARFNQLFCAAFPKLLYINPSTSYNNAGLASIAKFGGVSQVAAVGETALTPDQTKSQIMNFLAQSNISTYGNVVFDQHTITQLENGATLTPPKILSGGEDTSLINPNSDWWKDFKLPGSGNFLDVLALALGVTVPTVIVGGVVVLILLRD